ncbi:MAG: hypothetical protein Q4A78_09965 [Peptostreptococcaceae bacterium]|nr:hypothetical protein [Peptostreptococcaceae bacterium]
MKGFKFKNTHSRVFGLWIKTQKLPFAPREKYEVVEVPGRKGAWYFPDGTEDLVLSFECALKGSYAEREKQRDKIAKWLKGTGTLVVDLNGKSYTVKAVRFGDGMIGRLMETFTVEFVCEVK